MVHRLWRKEFGTEHMQATLALKTRLKARKMTRGEGTGPAVKAEADPCACE
jgi:hypothetical protein